MLFYAVSLSYAKSKKRMQNIYLTQLKKLLPH